MYHIKFVPSLIAIFKPFLQGVLKKFHQTFTFAGIYISVWIFSHWAFCLQELDCKSQIHWLWLHHADQNSTTFCRWVFYLHHQHALSTCIANIPLFSILFDKCEHIVFANQVHKVHIFLIQDLPLYYIQEKIGRVLTVKIPLYFYTPKKSLGVNLSA